MNGDQMRETTDDLVTEVMSSTVVLEVVFTSLLPDLPDDELPGEDKAKVLFDPILGSVEIATAAGEQACRSAIALIGSIGERILADLHTAALLEIEHRDTP